jgi:hypothetical protein
MSRGWLCVAAVMVVLVAGAAAKEAAFTLAPLPYAYDALEPHIDTLTMQLHHVRIQPPPLSFPFSVVALR